MSNSKTFSPLKTKTHFFVHFCWLKTVKIQDKINDLEKNNYEFTSPEISWTN